MAVIAFPTKAGAAGAEIPSDPSKQARRASLAEAKALAPDDPIFAAIERYEAADDESNRIVGQEPRPKSAAHHAWRVKYEPAVDRYTAARDAMLQTAPATRIGAAALIRYVLDEADDVLDSEDATMLLETLGDSILKLL
jgi:hypothetical protein